MLKYIAKRLAYALLILLGVSIIIYFLIRLMPVDYIQNKINAMNENKFKIKYIEDYNEAQNIAIENNCDRIELSCWLFNKNALEMYEHIGFDRQRIMYEMKL